MNLAFITPTRCINLFGNQGDFHLGLSHLMDRYTENEYERALRESGLPIILDNGLFENHNPEGIDPLLTKAIRIKATHFFAPDVLYDAKGTLMALHNTLYVMDQRLLMGKVKVAAVVQGKTESEFFELYDQYQSIPEVELIGLSILAIPRCFGSWNESPHKKSEIYQHNDEEIVPTRIKVLKKLLERGNNHKPVHLLGLGSSYEDVIFAKENCPFVVSNDTSSCFQNGLKGRRIIGDTLQVEGGKVKEKVNFDLRSIKRKQADLIQENINQVKSVLCK